MVFMATAFKARSAAAAAASVRQWWLCGGGRSSAPATTTNALAAAAVAATSSSCFATGPAASSAGTISDELLMKLKTMSTQALIDGLWIMGWPDSFIEGARPLSPNQKMAGRAVTCRFVPARPDIAQDKPGGVDSPEYEAFEQTGPMDAVVMQSAGPWESVGGDVKFLRLAQKKCAGLVTDGSVRDTDALIEYGFPVYSHSTTPKQGPNAHWPWETNGIIQCGGVVVRPGDAVVGDQDGVVVVPAAVAQQVYDIAHSREQVETIVKEELSKNPGPPGKYYPFVSGKIKKDSPLSKLLASKGLDSSRFYSTSARAWSRGVVTSDAAAGTPPPHRHLAQRRHHGNAHRSYSSSSSSSSSGGNSRMASKSSLAFRAGNTHLSHMRSKADMDEVCRFITEHKATAVLRTPTEASASKAMDAAIDGGFKVCEFTLTTPGCLDRIAEYHSKPGLLFGCGTVMCVEDAEKAMDAGARFIVMPCLIEEVVTWCAERNIACIPGCGTPSELYKAYRLGAPIQKVFPGVAGGPAWVMAVGKALPMLRLNPTSGVDIDTAVDFLRAGANSLGFVAPLFDPTEIKNEEWDKVHARAVRIIANCKSAM